MLARMVNYIETNCVKQIAADMMGENLSMLSRYECPCRGDCHRSNGSAESAAANYKRALEVEPGNWMVKTRLSLAHYLKVSGYENWTGEHRCFYITLVSLSKP